MATFQDRLNAAMGERGYSSMMRRSVQTVFLYEAHRCLKDKLPSLRPFQRKLAVFDQAIYLVNDSSLLPQQREEVLYKKVMSKELMDPETMWRRVRNVVSEVKKVAEQVQPLCTKKKTHLEVYYSFLQKNYVSVCMLSLVYTVRDGVFIVSFSGLCSHGPDSSQPSLKLPCLFPRTERGAGEEWRTVPGTMGVYSQP